IPNHDMVVATRKWHRSRSVYRYCVSTPRNGRNCRRRGTEYCWSSGRCACCTRRRHAPLPIETHAFIGDGRTTVGPDNLYSGSARSSLCRGGTSSRDHQAVTRLEIRYSCRRYSRSSIRAYGDGGWRSAKRSSAKGSDVNAIWIRAAAGNPIHIGCGGKDDQVDPRGCSCWQEIWGG